MDSAVGVHVFAGGFTHGVQRTFNVEAQYETHNFGLESARKMCGIDVVNFSSSDEWPSPSKDCVLCFGNPRCTGFSCTTAGLSSSAHGPWAKQTKDIHDLMQYGINHNVPFIVWESVTQAATTGRELLNYLRDALCVPNSYRIAHVFVTTRSFDNAQDRRRYFFVAYKSDFTFNVSPPDLSPFFTVTRDVIEDVESHECHAVKYNDVDYDENSFVDLTPDEWAVVPHLESGWNLHTIARYKPSALTPKQKHAWENRISDMPFSMHCVHRIPYDGRCPTFSSSCCRVIHPVKDRPLTIGELSKLMGWSCIPAGKAPAAQIAKGVVPAVGEWLADQVSFSLANQWSSDYEWTYNATTNEFKGADTTGAVEKTFNLLQYKPYKWAGEEKWKSLIH